MDSDTQIVWGVFSAFNKTTKLDLNYEELPYAEGNDSIWSNGNLQLKESEIEIIAFDSSYTIVKFTNNELSKKFKDFFKEAIELEKHK